jgi:enamine deaminase RidA (YjgF/YER057c/UK114 family)
MAPPTAVLTGKAPKPIPQLSQAVKYNGMVYCSGSLGVDPETSKFVEGTVKDRTVCTASIRTSESTFIPY